MKNIFGIRSVVAAFAALVPSVAFAHHPLGGEVPSTLFQGLISGLAHPVIGFDHLAFIIAVGLVTAFASKQFMGRFMGPLGFLGGMFAGCLLTLTGLQIGFVEYVIMLSVVGMGSFAMFGRTLGSTAAVVALAAIGLFHGYAYGGAVIGAEASPILTYLLGLLFVQGMIIFATQEIVRAFAGFDAANAVWVRVSGGVVAGIGAAIVLETAESLIF
ncbi:MAG: HupE/UreJ family protein [Alphaproteobacteria bacterium]